MFSSVSHQIPVNVAVLTRTFTVRSSCRPRASTCSRVTLWSAGPGFSTHTRPFVTMTCLPLFQLCVAIQLLLCALLQTSPRCLHRPTGCSTDPLHAVRSGSDDAAPCNPADRTLSAGRRRADHARQVCALHSPPAPPVTQQLLGVLVDVSTRCGRWAAHARRC